MAFDYAQSTETGSSIYTAGPLTVIVTADDAPPGTPSFPSIRPGDGKFGESAHRRADGKEIKP